jgi:hypothetical protein
MRFFPAHSRPLTALIALLAASGLGACTHDGFGTQALHYATFATPEPKGATVHVCHAYGCKMQTKFTFSDADLKALASLMAATRGKAADTPDEERRAIAYAIGWMETRVGAVIGTKDDRAGMDFSGPGDPTQQDCVDEATNTTSYLTVLATAGLIKHHTVSVPFAKDNYLRGVSGWTHWTAVIVEKPAATAAASGTKAAAKTKTRALMTASLQTSAPAVDTAVAGGQRWAVDSWIYANGENPAIVKAEDWYIADLENLPAPRR